LDLRGQELEKTALSGAPYIVHFFPYDENKEDEIGGACSTYGGVEKCVRNFGWKT
jgi:hypothetical protein